jgi:hypothetical protein
MKLANSQMYKLTRETRKLRKTLRSKSPHPPLGAESRRVIVRKRRKMIPRGDQKTPKRAKTLSQ